jgi:hypothetical protein
MIMNPAHGPAPSMRGSNELTQTAAAWVPEHADIEELKRAAEDCRGC